MQSFTMASKFSLCVVAMLSTANGADIIGVPLADENGQAPPTLPADTNEDIVREIDHVSRLNRFTFEQTILADHSDAVPHWIVLFCPPWYEPCQALEPVFKQFARKWQNQLNNAVLSTEVRFAAVDCSTEKALCNTQNVVTYPFVAHYRDRKQVKVWRGKQLDTDAKRLRDFLQKELGHIAAATTAEVDMEDVTAETGGLIIPVDFLLIFAAIAGNAWFISRGGFAGEPTSKQSKATYSSMPPSSSSQREQPGSCLARSLPKEWCRDRPSYEL